MSDDTTQEMPDTNSFEQRLLDRLDAIDARLKSLDGIDSRLRALEEQAERRSLETRPIWERALAEILEIKENVRNVERKLDVLSRDIVQVRADQSYLERRMEKLEPKPAQ